MRLTDWQPEQLGRFALLSSRVGELEILQTPLEAHMRGVGDEMGIDIWGPGGRKVFSVWWKPDAYRDDIDIVRFTRGDWEHYLI